jgi:hypothetical protein
VSKPFQCAMWRGYTDLHSTAAMPCNDTFRTLDQLKAHQERYMEERYRFTHDFHFGRQVYRELVCQTKEIEDEKSS